MVSILYDAVWGCLKRVLVYLVVFGDVKVAWQSLGLLEGWVYAGLSHAEANPPCWNNNEMEHFVRPDYFETSKHQKRRIKAF